MSDSANDGPDREGNYVRLHANSAYSKKRGGGISIKCPHCGSWNASHAVQHDGCECGAEATMWMKFKK